MLPAVLLCAELWVGPFRVPAFTSRHHCSEHVQRLREGQQRIRGHTASEASGLGFPSPPPPSLRYPPSQSSSHADEQTLSWTFTNSHANR